MSELILNARGTQFARNQCRAAEFLRLFAKSEGIDISISEDNYVAPVLIESDILGHLCNKTQYIKANSYVAHNFKLFDEEPTDEEIRAFQFNSLKLTMAAEEIDRKGVLQPDFSDYEKYITWFVKVLELLQQIEGIPELDFNADRFVIEYAPSNSEMKLAINLFGTDVISVENINEKLDKDVSVFANGLWAVYLVCIISAFGLEVSTENVGFYAEFIGATALETANLTTYFNLVQLFFSVFWLWLSDIIGRKPIFLTIIAIYGMGSGLLTIAKTFGADYVKQIAYLQGLRAFMGAGALIAPLGFVIAADASPPKNRSLATIMINSTSAFGGLLASFLNIYLGSAPKYNTKKLLIGTTEYAKANIDSFVDAHYWATGTFIFGFIICVFVLPETQPRIAAARHLKKMGIKAPQTKEIKAQPMYKVLFSMCRNGNLVLLFFAYWIGLLGQTNSKTGGPVFMMKMYTFTDANQTKSYINIVIIFNLLFSILVCTLGGRWFVKRYGEIRLIIASQVVTIFESIISFSINMPISKETMFLTLSLAAIGVLLGDATFLQVVPMYTTQQNRGQVLRIFQIGNSVGRTLSGVVTGVICSTPCSCPRAWFCWPPSGRHI